MIRTMIDRIVVLGGGSAGFIAAISLRAKLPAVRVVVIRSKELGIIGVGEGTTVSVPNYLHGFLGIDPIEFHRAVTPTFKLGIKFLWGPRPFFNYTFSPQFDMRYGALPRATGFYCYDDDESVQYAAPNAALMSLDKAFVRLPGGAPGVRNDVAYHMENADFVGFLETHAQCLGVEIEDDTIADIEQDDHGITALLGRSGKRHTADLYVDASGFVSALLGKALAEPFVSFKSSLFCDRAVVGGWQRGPDEPVKPYTTAETMESGWCWQIEHDHRINRGYVYSSAFISDDAAEREFRAKAPKVEATRIVKFISGRYARGWVKNVVAVGNACGFVEPLESTSLFVICEESGNLAESLIECERQPGPAMAGVYNRRVIRTWDDIRRFLAIHYRFNRRVDSEFWRACLEKTDLADAQDFVDYYLENGPSARWGNNLVGGRDAFGFEGYLSMMVGMRVPYRRTNSISDAERQTWAKILQNNRAQAAAGLTMSESLQVIRSPHFKVKPGFYHYP
jgi:tryptophan halogenase